MCCHHDFTDLVESLPRGKQGRTVTIPIPRVTTQELRPASHKALRQRSWAHTQKVKHENGANALNLRAA